VLGYAPKVLSQRRRFMLAADLRYRAQNTSQNDARKA
jgi:hypothetical protein